MSVQRPAGKIADRWRMSALAPFAPYGVLSRARKRPKLIANRPYVEIMPLVYFTGLFRANCPFVPSAFL